MENVIKYFKNLPAKISSNILTQKPQRGYHATCLFSIWCSIGNTFTHHEDKCGDKGRCHTIRAQSFTSSKADLRQDIN